jgi:methyl-accepting chemotaxis protein
MADEFERTVGAVVDLVGAGAGHAAGGGLEFGRGGADQVDHGADRPLELVGHRQPAAAHQTAGNIGTVSAAAEELGASVREIGRQVSGVALSASRLV